MDAGGLNHKDCILSFCSKLNALKVCSSNFFIWELERYYFLLNVKFTSKAPVLDWAAWSHMPLNRVVVTRPKVYRLASLGERLKEEVEHNASESNSLTANEVYGLNPFRITHS